MAANRNHNTATLGKFHAAQGGKMFLLQPLRFNGAQRATSYEGFKGGSGIVLFSLTLQSHEEEIKRPELNIMSQTGE